MLRTPNFSSNHVYHADDVATATTATKIVVANCFSDSHCHIHLSVAPSDLGNSEQSQCFRSVSEESDANTEEGAALLEDEVPLTVLCATCEDDWDLIDKILTEQTEYYNSLLPWQETKETSSEKPLALPTPSHDDARGKQKHNRKSRRHRIVGGFGIHPWWAQQATEATFARLESLLVKHSTAIVAEIGIDTIRFSPPPSPSSASSTNRCCATPSKGFTCNEKFDAATRDTDDNNNNISTNATAASRTSAMGVEELSSEQNPSGAAPRKGHDSDEDREELLRKQLMVLKRQLSLAARYQRPVSVHVVGKGTYGIITEYFEEIAARNREIMGAVAVHGAVPIGAPASPTYALSSVSPRDEAAGQPRGEQEDYRVASASLAQQRRLFSQYTPLPPTVVFHGFTGSVDFYKHLAGTFCLSSRERAAEAKARAAMEEATYEVTDSGHPIHPAGPSRLAFPCPEFFIGVGPRTTFRTKAFSQLFAKTVPVHTSTADLSPDLPNSRSLSAKDIKALRQMPSDFVVLETDTFYAHNYLGGHATKVPHDVWIPEADAETLSAELLKMASIMAKPYRGMSNDVRVVSSAADLPPGGGEQMILKGVLMHCHRNLQRALRHVLPFT